MDQFSQPPGSKIEKFEKIKTKIQNTLSDLYTQVLGEKFDELLLDIVNKASDLEKKYPNRDEYGVYHALISSTQDVNLKVVYDDFPGEDSIELFVERLRQKYLK
ncbi:MAG: hypothetical protein WD991_01315 [Candidatus Paceibacterota bacterium]